MYLCSKLETELTLMQKGHLALIVDKLTIDKGEDVLKTYQFGSKAVEHKVTY
jgi:hypothetical protein